MTLTETRAPVTVLGHPGEAGGYAPPASHPSQASFGDVQIINDLWVASGRLLPGTQVVWHEDHQDEAIFILDGAVSLNGALARAGDAVLIDAGVSGTLEAVEPSRVLHYGSAVPGPPTDGPYGPAPVEGRSARVVTQANARHSVKLAPDGTRYAGCYFTDGSDATNRIALFRISIDRPSFTPPHSHTQDELIYMLKGRIRSGTVTVNEGETLAVAKDIRYSFRSEEEVTFLNFRRDASYITLKKNERRLEVAEASEN